MPVTVPTVLEENRVASRRACRSSLEVAVGVWLVKIVCVVWVLPTPHEVERNATTVAGALNVVERVLGPTRARTSQSVARWAATGVLTVHVVERVVVGEASACHVVLRVWVAVARWVHVVARVEVTGAAAAHVVERVTVPTTVRTGHVVPRLAAMLARVVHEVARVALTEVRTPATFHVLARVAAT